MIAKILFTVFCLVVIGTESRHFLGRGKSSDDPALDAFLCNQAVENCAFDMVRQYDHIWKSETPEKFIYQDGFIDEVCNEVQPMKECIQEVLNTHKCSNDQREMLTVYINLEDPACTDEGKQAILATADSDCWQDKEMGYEAIMSARGCYGTFMFETDSTCQHRIKRGILPGHVACFNVCQAIRSGRIPTDLKAKMMATLAFALCLVILGAESFEISNLNKRQDEYNAGGPNLCSRALLSCVLGTVRTHFHSPDVFLHKLYQDGFLDGLCREFREAVECLQQAEQSLECADSNIRGDTSIVYNLVNFACSERGMLMLLATEGYMCITDSQQLFLAYMSSERCGRRYRMDYSCESLHSMILCIRDAFSPCGDLVVEIAQEALVIVNTARGPDVATRCGASPDTLVAPLA